MRIILGLLMIAAGTAITLKSEALMSAFGRIQWFEEKLAGAGGSRFGYKLMGIIMLAAGILVLTNIHASLLTAFANLLIPGA